ncbi:FAD:protein FMN transferase [Texcoconibacillus texcoconensis]|uniref:FAD:protein FMN transferase n=1 Tax=Texcoconibacillus texcoconensis TaxID=1095777 RepID=A0A840QQV4_9BACI|nr:FAD:protein FMN transferase [Texcoconibacillus texcoconensis]MBB5173729.1 thiamine biosynthesis lipoprotein [Texcoconibacillus texcoconensis]
MRKKSHWSWLVGTLIIATGCSESTANEADGQLGEPYQKSQIVMGTNVSVQIFDEGKEEFLDIAFEQMEEYSDITAMNEKNSEVDLINQNAGKKPVEVSDEVFTLVEEGIKHAETTEGLFDISIGPLTSLWNIGFEDARKPEQSEIDDVLPLIDHTKIQTDNEEQTVYLEEEGMMLDLGGIAKGYFADLVAELFEENGVEKAIIDLGGNIVVMGDKYDGEAWSVGIQDPLAIRGQSIGTIDVKDKSVVTSGIYERVLEEDGENYHHLLSPTDGYPFMNELAGVTVISDESIDGDALSTMAFAQGLYDGLEFIEEMNEIDGIFVTRDKEVYTTSGAVDDFQLRHKDYELID